MPAGISNGLTPGFSFLPAGFHSLVFLHLFQRSRSFGFVFVFLQASAPWFLYCSLRWFTTFGFSITLSGGLTSFGFSITLPVFNHLRFSITLSVV